VLSEASKTAIPEYGFEELSNAAYSVDLARTVSTFEVHAPEGRQFSCDKELKSATEDWLNKERNFRCLGMTLSTCTIDMRSALMLIVTTIYPATVPADAYRAQNIWNTHRIYYLRWVTVCNRPLRPTQPSTLSGAESEYWPLVKVRWRSAAVD